MRGCQTSFAYRQCGVVKQSLAHSLWCDSFTMSDTPHTCSVSEQCVVNCEMQRPLSRALWPSNSPIVEIQHLFAPVLSSGCQVNFHTNISNAVKIKCGLGPCISAGLKHTDTPPESKKKKSRYWHWLWFLFDENEYIRLCLGLPTCLKMVKTSAYQKFAEPASADQIAGFIQLTIQKMHVVSFSKMYTFICRSTI